MYPLTTATQRTNKKARLRALAASVRAFMAISCPRLAMLGRIFENLV